MNNFRDVVAFRKRLAGTKYPMDKIVGRRLEFTAWDFRKSHIDVGNYLILQFRDGDGFGVVITASKCIMDDLRAYASAAGDEPFMATIEHKGKAYVFR